RRRANALRQSVPGRRRGPHPAANRSPRTQHRRLGYLLSLPRASRSLQQVRQPGPRLLLPARARACLERSAVLLVDDDAPASVSGQQPVRSPSPGDGARLSFFIGRGAGFARQELRWTAVLIWPVLVGDRRGSLDALGQQRIANELWVKLGLRVSPRTPGVGTRETVHLMDSCVGGVVSVLGK